MAINLQKWADEWRTYMRGYIKSQRLGFADSNASVDKNITALKILECVKYYSYCGLVGIPTNILM